MALEDLNPAVRVEEILNAADIEPATRLEYFMKKAANEVPKPAGSSDAGKVPTVNEDGDGYELGEIPSGLPEMTTEDFYKVATVVEDRVNTETKTVIPEQTVTFAQIQGFAFWAAALSGAGLNEDFFKNAEVGTVCDISLDDADPVEATASSVFGYTLFGIGNFYVGYVRLAGGVAILSTTEPADHDHKIMATADLPTPKSEWKYPFVMAHYEQNAKVKVYIIGHTGVISFPFVGELVQGADFVQCEMGVIKQDSGVLKLMFGLLEINSSGCTFTPDYKITLDT